MLCLNWICLIRLNNSVFHFFVPCSPISDEKQQTEKDKYVYSIAYHIPKNTEPSLQVGSCTPKY